MTRFAPLFSGLMLAAGCSGAPQAAVDDGRFEGLGPHSRPVSNAGPRAQALFDQGLAFLYAFNHDEAIRSFELAGADSPSCAMAWWGVALANGPHINNPAMDASQSKAAWAALVKARAAASKAPAVEAALIEALGRRYADPPPADRAPLDAAYAEAMRRVREMHPADPDVGALCAEALMDLHPWDLWTADGKAQPWTPEIVELLEAVIRQAPDHPLALHLYIHAVEASPAPGRADAAADRLRDLCPGLGHLVHMPSHIDVRRGRWREAVLANQKAIRADAVYRKRSPDQGFYHVYMAHNRHMLAYASMMRGQSAQATAAIREMVEAIPGEFVQAAAAVVDGFFSMPYEMHLRFGRWDEMLAEPKPRDVFPLTTALWHYARGTAWAAKGDAAKAREEQWAFGTARAKVPPTSVFGNNAAADILKVADRILEGEILYREGKTDAALAALREAVAAEDGLRYDEPPDWIQPTRHILGAALMDAGRADQAEAVYREDLERLPENGWSLLGMTRSLRMQGKDAGEFQKRFEAVWADADLKPTSSCLCLPGTP